MIDRFQASVLVYAEAGEVVMWEDHKAELDALQSKLDAMEKRMAEERVAFMEDQGEQRKKLENREARLKAAETRLDDMQKSWTLLAESSAALEMRNREMGIMVKSAQENLNRLLVERDSALGRLDSLRKFLEDEVADAEKGFRSDYGDGRLKGIKSALVVLNRDVERHDGK